MTARTNRWISFLGVVLLVSACSYFQKAEEPLPPPPEPEVAPMPSVPLDMVEIPEGEFMMGSQPEKILWIIPSGESDEQPPHPVKVPAFYIDMNEVTRGQYAKCVAAGKCKEPQQGENCNWNLPNRDEHPINCVDWGRANSFCAWAGKRLPTEAEWEKAARGSDGRTYPWGSEPAAGCEIAVMADAAGPGCGKGGTAAVGTKSRGASPYGLADMAGNVAEWVDDWYGKDTYKASEYTFKGPRSGTEKVVRGGSFKDGADGLRAANREAKDPKVQGMTAVGLGFRCAKDM